MSLLCCLWVITGCTTHFDRLREPRQAFYRGDLQRSAELLGKRMESYPKDAEVLALDLALVKLAAGRPGEAESMLRKVRDRFDELEEKDATEMAASLLLDSQRKSYAGEDYERVLVRVMLALSNLMGEGDDAESYALQVNAKQQQLARQSHDRDDPAGADAYLPLAIGPYLRGVLREANHVDYDDAQRAYAQVVSWQPGFQAGHADLQRAANGRHSAPGNGVVYVFALVGRGPVKVEATAEVTSAALLIADRIVSAMGKYELPPTLAPVKIPEVYLPPSEVDCLVVSSDAGPAERTDLVCDIGELALRQQQIQRPRWIAEAVVRRVIKKGAVVAAKDRLQVRSPWTDLALTAAGVVWEATEAADTRCWGLLPGQVQVVRLELPAGQHILRMQPVRDNHAVGRPIDARLTIIDGENTYALGYFPGPSPVGQVLVSQPGV